MCLCVLARYSDGWCVYVGHPNWAANIFPKVLLDATQSRIAHLCSDGDPISIDIGAKALNVDIPEEEL